MYGQVPEWYWSSERQKQIEQYEIDFKKEHPCQCRDEEYPMTPFTCYCVDGVSVVDFCEQHGGNEPSSSECLCCIQLPVII